MKSKRTLFIICGILFLIGSVGFIFGDNMIGAISFVFPAMAMFYLAAKNKGNK